MRIGTNSICVVIGTRPEAVKMAPVVRALREAPEFRVQVVSTGQHREMLRQVCERFRITVDLDLDVMRPDQTLAGLSARVIEGFDNYLQAHSPSAVLVQGDTTTVLMSALACFYRKIPVGHVEAGLRTGNLLSPFPEEANRRLAAPLVRWHFAPTPLARDNLLREGIPESAVHVTGNTVVDALNMEIALQEEPDHADALSRRLLELLGPSHRPMVLVTGHRREHFGGGFKEICAAILRLAEAHPEIDFVYPVHLNPNVQGPVLEHLSGRPNIRLVPPVPYDLFVAMLRRCILVLTDSGGVQEEAPGLGKPVLVMRDTTERPEGVTAGVVLLVGPCADNIFREAHRLLSSPSELARFTTIPNPYGDGRAARRIARILQSDLLPPGAGAS